MNHQVGFELWTRQGRTHLCSLGSWRSISVSTILTLGTHRTQRSFLIFQSLSRPQSQKFRNVPEVLWLPAVLDLLGLQDLLVDP